MRRNEGSQWRDRLEKVAYFAEKAIDKYTTPCYFI